MRTRTTLARLPALLATAWLAVGCSDSLPPGPQSPGAPEFSHTGSDGIALDQHNGSLGEAGPVLIKGFDPTNPHHGSTIIATFYWVGSTNIIDSVTDHLTTPGFPPVGNRYTLVEYVTAGGFSMATYVATNVQGFPDPNPPRDSVLAVRANLSVPAVDGGVKLSAWTGVEPVPAHAVGAHRSAAGSGSSETIAAPGAIPVGAGGLAYAVTMSNGRVGLVPPEGFTSIGGTGSDAVIKEDGRYRVQDSASFADPRWTWFFEAPSTWLATVLALNPAGAEPPPATRLAFGVQPSTTPPATTMKPVVQVTTLDDLGNPAAGFTGLVTIAIGQNGGLVAPGTLSGTRTVAAVDGVATFSDLSIDQPGNGYTLVVTAAGLVGAESARFNIGAL